MKIRTIIEIILLIIALIMAFLLFNKRNESKFNEKLYYKDTIMIEKNKDSIIIKHNKPKLIFLRDTIIQSKPFIALIDTVIKKDSIKIDYSFPENDLNLSIKSANDTLQIPIIKEEKRNIVADFLPAFLIGIILGLIGALIK